jgi:enhancing lycopene biosynthesis protein 2
MKRRIAVIFSGCGYLDGAEITESVSSLIALDQAGVDYTCFAIDKDIPEVDHLTKKETGATRNALKEAARIARSEIQPLSELDEKDFDGVLLPGGFGAAKHLSSFAMEGSRGKVNPNIQSILSAFHSASKPIAAFCIAPATVALALGKHNVQVTIGEDAGAAAEIEKTGAQHVTCDVDDFVTDRENKIVTSPAYMYETSPAKVFSGIQKAVREFVEMS